MPITSGMTIAGLMAAGLSGHGAQAQLLSDRLPSGSLYVSISRPSRAIAAKTDATLMSAMRRSSTLIELL